MFSTSGKSRIDFNVHCAISQSWKKALDQHKGVEHSITEPSHTTRSTQQDFYQTINRTMRDQLR